MKPTESLLGQPIRSLQTMLRVLAENDDEYKVLIPDGIYGPDTMAAALLCPPTRYTSIGFVASAFAALPPKPAAQTTSKTSAAANDKILFFIITLP